MFRLLLLVGIPVLLLAACRGMQALSPEEVLQRSMQENAVLSSVSYTVRATHITGSGTHTDVLLQGNLHRESQTHDWHMSVERNGVFIGSMSGARVEPDDLYLLPLPINLLTVVKDTGQMQWDGRTVYRYDVALRDAETDGLLDTLTGDPFPLPTFRFTGTLWIDTESFLLQRSTWDIVTQTTDEMIRLDVTLQNHNTAQAIHIPDATEERLPMTQASAQRIFDTIPPSLSLLLGTPHVTREMQ